MEGAERPDSIAIRKQIASIMAFEFDWRETRATIQERLAADTEKAAAFGVTIAHDVKATIILANIATAARFDSGGTENGDAQRKIRAAYRYNHVHDDTSIKFIMKQITTADEQRDLATISGTSSGMANMVMQQMMQAAGNETSASEEERAFAATSESESSVEKQRIRRGRATERKPVQKYYPRVAAPSDSPSPSRSTRGPYVSPTRRSTSMAAKKLAPHEVNPTKCKWCKKWGGNGSAHGPPAKVPHVKCNYNEEWDGWRPHYVYRRMNIAYKDRDDCEE